MIANAIDIGHNANIKILSLWFGTSPGIQLHPKSLLDHFKSLLDHLTSDPQQIHLFLKFPFHEIPSDWGDIDRFLSNERTSGLQKVRFLIEERYLKCSRDVLLRNLPLLDARGMLEFAAARFSRWNAW